MWSDVTRLATLDERGAALVYPSSFAGMPCQAAVVALTHPACRLVNVKYRQYKNLEGNAAELALVRDALTRVGNG